MSTSSRSARREYGKLRASWSPTAKYQALWVPLRADMTALKAAALPPAVELAAKSTTSPRQTPNWMPGRCGAPVRSQIRFRAETKALPAAGAARGGAVLRKLLATHSASPGTS